MNLTPNIMTALDLGSDSFCCLMAAVDGSKMSFLGLGRQPARGIAQGHIVDMKEATMAIEETVRAAEKIAGHSVERVWLSIGSQHVRSCFSQAQITIQGEEITERDTSRLVDKATSQNVHGRPLLHALPLSFIIDGGQHVHAPIGLMSSHLKANIHVIRAEAVPMANVVKAINLCRIDIMQSVCSAYASGMAVLDEDERKLGALVVDMGASQTSYGVFRDGRFIETGALPIGSHHMTKDIALITGLSLYESERAKRLYGMQSERDDHRPNGVVPESTIVLSSALKTDIGRIVRSRLEEIMEGLGHRLGPIGLETMSMVFTGGAAALPGLEEFAHKTFIPADSLVRHYTKKRIRVGVPSALEAGPECLSQPAFATCIGLLELARQSYDLPPSGASVLQFLRGHFDRLFGKGILSSTSTQPH